MKKSLEDVIQLHQAGRLEEAKRGYQQILEQSPDFAAVHNNLGTIYFRQNQFKEAVSAYQAAIECQPDYIDAYYNLGLALTKLYRQIEAKNAYEALLALDPDHAGGHFQLGCLLMALEKYEPALAHFSTIMEDHPYHYESQINLATCYLKLGLASMAEKYYLAALAVTPGDTQLLFNLGVLSMQQGRAREAARYYLQAINVTPDFFAAHNNLGVAFLALKDKKAALLHFEEALRLKPDSEAIRHTIHVLRGNHEMTSSPAEYVRTLFDSYADHYDAHLLESLHYQLPDAMLEIVQTNLGDRAQSLSILDLGCGTGLCGERFKSMAHELVGVDLSQNMLEIASKKHIYTECVMADINAFLADKHDRYDLILAGDVLVYIGDLSELFSRVAHALKTGGWFVFNTEISETDNFQMTEAGRFAHRKTYLDQLIEQHHFHTLQYREVMLRTQNGSDISGHLYLVRLQ